MHTETNIPDINVCIRVVYIYFPLTLQIKLKNWKYGNCVCVCDIEKLVGNHRLNELSAQIS